MSEPRTAVERLDDLRAVLCADGWPGWLDATSVDATGPTVQLRPDAPADARADVVRLAAAYGVRITYGESYVRLDDDARG